MFLKVSNTVLKEYKVVNMSLDKKVIKYLKRYLGEDYSPERFSEESILSALFPEPTKELGVTIGGPRFAEGKDLGYDNYPFNSQTALSVKIALKPRYVVSVGKPYAVGGSFVLNIFPKMFSYEGLFRNVAVSHEIPILGNAINLFSQAFFNSQAERKDNKLIFSSVYGSPSDVVYALENMMVAIQLIAPQEGGNTLWSKMIDEGVTSLLTEKIIKKPEDLLVSGISVRSSTPSSLELEVNYIGAISTKFGNVFPLNGAYCKPENLTATVKVERPPLQPDNKLPEYAVHPPKMFRVEIIEPDIIREDLTPQ